MKSALLVRAVTALGLGVAGLAVSAPTAHAAPADHLVINETYLSGGSAGAAYKNKFVELYNPTSSDVDLSGWSLQYRSATGTGAFTAATLSGTIPKGGYYLVTGASNGTNGADLTGDKSTTLNPSGTTGTLALVHATTALPATVTGDVTSVESANAIADLVGYGTSNTYEGSVASAPSSNTDVRSAHRTDGADTNVNHDDFVLSSTISPCTTAGCPSGSDPGAPVDATIEEVQGTGTASPLAQKVVTTKGVVTAVYATGGFSGAYIQTPGTGGSVDLATHTASDGLFVYGSAFASAVHRGDYVSVTGTVTEYNGLTELTAASGGYSVLTDSHAAVTPATIAFPLSEAQRESLEGMLLAPQGSYTVTDNYATNQYGEVALASGTSPLEQPTNAVRPGTQAYTDLVASNATRLVTLDDGSSLNFLSSANTDVPLPWLTQDDEVRIGAPVTFTAPVVLDYRNSQWDLQPTQQLVAGGDEPVTFGSTRTAAPKDVGGSLRLATFNVLNYFPTTGEDYVASGGTCSFYDDREGTPLTVDDCGAGPRGAATQASFERQQAKIVAAINRLGADVVSLEEIENSAKLGQPRDTALNTLVAALNAATGEDTWAAVPSPATIPTNGEDVIRTAFIYRKATAQPVGDSVALDDPAFAVARAPLSQAFKPVGAPSSSTFLVIVNHFKSKSSGSGVDADQGDGQGASNHARTLQAHALVDFAASREEAVGTHTVFLSGDFNAYNHEDPVQVIEDAGYVNVPERLTDKQTYAFDGMVGSLDHVFASPSAFSKVAGADIWNINAYESVGREYSRYNENVTNLYRADPYRASDHDPEVIGFDPAAPATTLSATAPQQTRSGAGFDVTVTASAASGTPSGTVTVSDGSTQVGSGTLSDGRAVVAVDGDLSLGSHTLTVTYEGDGDHAAATTEVDVTVLKAVSDLKATVADTPYGTSPQVHVTAAPGTSGLVYVAQGQTVLGIGSVSDGAGTVTLGKTVLVPGSYDLEVFYGGSEQFDPTDTSVSLTVTKAVASVAKTSLTSPIVKNRTAAKLGMKVSAAGVTPTGRVSVYWGTKLVGTTTLSGGKATVTLKKFTSSGSLHLTVKYAGSATVAPSQTTYTIKVAAS